MKASDNRQEPRKAGDRYHHGDLRAALLEAGEAELVASGVEGFSLRRVAKRAGVSHAAPAHHFKDANGLLTALAAEGYRRFLAAKKTRQASAAPDSASQLSAFGMGYIDFATDNPALFQLMFSSGRPDHENPELGREAKAAFDHLMQGIQHVSGNDPYSDESAMMDAIATWAVTHGLADLLNAGHLKYLQGLDPEARDHALMQIFSRFSVRQN